MSSEALATLVAEYQPRVRAFFARRCGNSDDVDDLVQETFASIARTYQSYASRSTLSTWVYAVCRNVHSNFTYYRNRDQCLIRRIENNFSESPPEPPIDIQPAIGKLSRESKRLFMLHYVQGRCIREIASALGRPEGTVKYLLHRLRQQVKDSLDE
jgi:RNA polymerase sigma-70 factor (ECF subfamily)